MREALSKVVDEHKKKVRALKEQLSNERKGDFFFFFSCCLFCSLFVHSSFATVWEAEKSDLQAKISSLERTRDEMRVLLREQREQLERVTALVDEGDSKVSESPLRKVASQQTAANNGPAGKKARVARSSNSTPDVQENKQRSESEVILVGDDKELKHGEEEWVIVQFGDSKHHVSKERTAYKQVVRGKRARQALPETSDCPQCRAYFDVIASEIPNVSRKELVQVCKRAVT